MPSPNGPFSYAQPSGSGNYGADEPDTDAPKLSAAQVLKKFASYYKPYRFLFYFDLFCAVILACVDLAFPQFLQFFTKDFFLRPAPEVLGSLGLIAAIFVALYLVRTACQYFITSWGHVMGAYMEADMRASLFGQYQRLSFSYYDKHNTGAMMSRLLTDLFDISELAHHGPENLFICSLKIIGSFVLLSLINMPLALCMAGITCLMALYAAWRNYIRRTIFRANRERMADVNTRVQDSLGGIRVVKSFGGEAAEMAKFQKTNVLFTNTKKEAYRFMGSFHAVNSLYQGALYTITVVGGGYCVATGSMQAVDLAMFALYIGIFISPVEQLVNFVETFQKGYAGFRRFCEVMALEPDVQDKPGAPSLAEAVAAASAGAAGTEKAAAADASASGAAEAKTVATTAGADATTSATTNELPRGEVHYRNVSFEYNPGSPVLRDFNLTIPAGKTVALVGPSGGGKTTACSLLPRFYDVQTGAVEIDGVDVRDVSLKSLRAAIGLVQQDVYLFNGSIRDNIAYGRADATQAEIEWAAKQANIASFIESLEDGYDTLVGERGARLSGGQKQRVAIARVFLRNPRILILDEATSALDNESERAVQQSLEQLSAGRTTLVIAHRLSTIRSADLIAVVDKGRVVEQGTHSELLALGGTYATYYHLQFGD